MPRVTAQWQTVKQVVTIPWRSEESKYECRTHEVQCARDCITSRLVMIQARLCKESHEKYASKEEYEQVDH